MAQIEQLAKTDPAGAQQEFLRAIAVNQRVQAIEAEQQNIANQKKTEAHESFVKQARERSRSFKNESQAGITTFTGRSLKAPLTPTDSMQKT
jgi:hypothetical protein